MSCLTLPFLKKDGLILYAICDNFEDAQSCLDAGAKVAQIRVKPVSGLYKLTPPTSSICMNNIIINDSIEYAIRYGALGVHLGQEDLVELKEQVKKIPKNMILGVSVRSEEDLRVAENIGANYIGVGPVFQSSTKMVALAKGIEGIVNLVSKSTIPAIAIGGISQQNYGGLVYTGIRGIAVSAELKKMSPQYIRKWAELLGTPSTSIKTK